MSEIDTSKPSRELDAEILRAVFGRTACVHGNTVRMWIQPPCQYSPGIPLPFYSTEIAAAYAMEAEIEQRGLHRQYVRHLAVVVEIVNYADIRQRYWLLAHATPWQRCVAALRAVESEVRP